MKNAYTEYIEINPEKRFGKPSLDWYANSRTGCKGLAKFRRNDNCRGNYFGLSRVDTKIKLKLV